MTNKVLMISNFRNLSGYSIAAENTLKAIHCANIPVAAQNINLTNKFRKLDQLTESLLKAKSSDANILLIYSLPSFFQYDNRFKLNIGYFDFEMSLTGTGWNTYCQLMDKIWVPSHFHFDLLTKNGFNTNKLKVVPHCVDTNRFTKSFNKNNWFTNYKNCTNHYLFYTISEYGSRKNYEGLLKAWHSHFNHSHKAELIIKSHKTGMSSEQLNHEIVSLNEYVKKELKMPEKFAKNPIIITEDWNSEDIDMLHNSCDCFVMTSYAECFSYPTLDALCFQKPVIATSYGGHLDFCNHTNSYLIAGSLTSPYHYGDLPTSLYNNHQKWMDVNTNLFGETMFHVYKNQDEGKQKGYLGQNLLEQYNYEKIGNTIKLLLE